MVIGAAGPAPILAEDAAASLIGKTPGEAEIEEAADYAQRAARPADNLALPGEYRKKMIKVFAKRAIEAALAALGKGAA